ncbi:hypothetical protein EG878_17135, partial [Enterococcus faecalis]
AALLVGRRAEVRAPHLAHEHVLQVHQEPRAGERLEALLLRAPRAPHGPRVAHGGRCGKCPPSGPARGFIRPAHRWSGAADPTARAGRGVTSQTCG